MAIKDAISALKESFGDQITTSLSELRLHGQSESHFRNMPPDAVAFPKSTDDVQRIVSICADHDCPVIGWGVGTSLEAQTSAVRGGVTVDFRDMNALLEISQEDMFARVQPGISREALNHELRATGLMFPVDPGANATLGGMASTRASGTTAVRYGTMRDNVMGLEAVTADGKAIRTGSLARKSSAGYDLTGLFVGAEGTLGLITELTVRLHGQPEATSAGICAFQNMTDAVDAVTTTIQTGIQMARIEFVDAATALAFNAYSGSEMPNLPHLMVEFHGSPTAVAEQSQMFGDIVKDHGGSEFEWAIEAEDRKKLWAMRHNGYYAILASRPGARAIVTDVCVPISKLAQAVDETRADIEGSLIPGPILGHVGDGNFHAILLIDPENAKEKQAALDLSSRMAERAIALGGTITGEHGVGIGKLDYMTAEHGDAWALMTQIKKALDPQNIMNPGKLIRVN